MFVKFAKGMAKIAITLPAQLVEEQVPVENIVNYRSLFVLIHSALDIENSIRSKGSPRTESKERWGIIFWFVNPAFCAQRTIRLFPVQVAVRIMFKP